MEKKPDFAELALRNACLSCEPSYAAGCEKIWTDYVTPLQSQLSEAEKRNERLLSALKDLSEFIERLGISPAAGFEYRKNAKQLINEIEKQ